MEGPLWTERHAPELADLPQADVRDHFERALEEPMNLVVHGPAGSGKTAAVRALTRAAHDNPGADRIEINVSDFFDSTKKEIANDPRFSRFIDSKRRRNSSKASPTRRTQRTTTRDWSTSPGRPAATSGKRF